MQKLVKVLGSSFHLLEVIAEGFVCLLVEPLFHLQEMGANMVVMFPPIHNKYQFRGVTFMRGEDCLMLYSCKNRELSPDIFMTVNKTIMKCVC